MNKLKNKTILITAGPTREYIDPVRYISNDSSGKMGYALAEAATKAGAKVTLISGPTNLGKPSKVKLTNVTTAKEMMSAALKVPADIIICAAAVSDFRPKKVSKKKIKKEKISEIKLIKNPDILATLSKKKRAGQIIVGFALETDSLIKNAREKLKKKGCDMIVANKADVISKDKTDIAIISKDGTVTKYKSITKKMAARAIIAQFKN